MQVDMHVHSSFSDGKKDVESIMGLAQVRKIDCISFTDHETIEGCKRALQIAKKFKVMVISGIEISADADCEMHILGYDFDVNSKYMSRYQNYIKKERFKESVYLLRKVRENLRDKELEKILQHNGFKTDFLVNVLIERGYVTNEEEAQVYFLQRGGALYVKKSELNAVEAIKLIVASGGKAVLAHPGRTKLSLSELENVIMELKKDNLWGLEVYHPSHEVEKINEYRALCDKYGLMITGGSDYHAKEIFKQTNYNGSIISSLYDDKQWQLRLLAEDAI